jgi:hypothetical protein
MRLLRSPRLAVALITTCLMVAAVILSNSPTETGLLAPVVYAEQPRALPQATPTYTFTAYLPLILLDLAPPTPTPTATATQSATPTPTATPVCPTASSNVYPTRAAYQADLDNPVRPASLHADKNIHLRGYVANTDSGFKRELVNYGSDDPNQPPQFATMFTPVRVPVLRSFYRVYGWNWTPSSEGPGTRGAPITTWPVTALGLATTPGEVLKTPQSVYKIGPDDVTALVIYADETSVTFNYHQSDSAGAQGYTIHVDGICTDQNLRTLYNELDNTARNTYVGPGYSYPLPALRANQPFGTAKDPETVVVIRDSGAFMDTRSCNEWWQIRAGYGGSCPAP